MNHLKAITVLAAWTKFLDVTVLAVMMYEPDCAVSKECWEQVLAVGHYANTAQDDYLIQCAVSVAADNCNTFYYG